MQMKRGLISTMKKIYFKIMHSSLSPNHYPPKQSHSHPLKKRKQNKTKTSYKIIASVGNEGKGARESYHTSGPQCFIIYVQIPAKNWCYME